MRTIKIALLLMSLTVISCKDSGTTGTTKTEDFKINYEDLKKRIKSLHRSLSNYEEVLNKNDLAYREYGDLAYWFYANLVAPALKNTKDLNQLIIVTDGELGHLPFEAFLVEPATPVCAAITVFLPISTL